MTYAIGNDATLGIACLGITHPHTSGRVKAFQRMPNAKVLGAYDKTPLLDLRRCDGDRQADQGGDPRRPRGPRRPDPPKSYLMADWAIEAMEAGKAVLCEKPAGRGSVDTVRLVETVEKTGQLFRVGYCCAMAPLGRPDAGGAEGRPARQVLQVRAHAGCSHGEADTDHMRQPGDIGGARILCDRLPYTIDRLLHHFGMPNSVNARISKFEGQMAPAAREDAAGAILNYDDKMITIDFMSGIRCPDRELGHHRLRHRGRDALPPAARPLQALHDRQDRLAGRLDRVGETSFPEIWAVRKTVPRPRSPRSAIRSTSTARPRPRAFAAPGAVERAGDPAHNINRIPSRRCSRLRPKAAPRSASDPTSPPSREQQNDQAHRHVEHGGRHHREDRREGGEFLRARFRGVAGEVPSSISRSAPTSRVDYAPRRRPLHGVREP